MTYIFGKSKKKKTLHKNIVSFDLSSYSKLNKIPKNDYDDVQLLCSSINKLREKWLPLTSSPLSIFGVNVTAVNGNTWRELKENNWLEKKKKLLAKIQWYEFCPSSDERNILWILF